MKKYYPIFCVDCSFSQWDVDCKYVGAKSRKDLVEHIKEVFPDSIIEVTEEEIEYYPNNKIGDKISYPWFDDDKLKEICNLKSEFSRIKKIEHMFTDKPYQILDTFSHFE